jgi:Na+/proline symporter
LGGWFLLNVGAYGLDQDMTQRALSCKNSKEAQKALMLSIYLTIPVAILFLFIGLLLYLFYQHPELSHLHTQVSQDFQGEKITIFMYYILHEMPEGMRGLVTIGAVAAALSSSNSVLGAMASVAIEDLYKPWRTAKDQQNNIIREALFYVKAGRKAVLMFAVALSLMAFLSFYWQRYSQLPLLSFALSVMAFAYTGLLAVFASAIFTKRGNETSVSLALISGFMTVLFCQPYMLGGQLGFAWQILLATFVAFVVMMLGDDRKLSQKSDI